MKRLCAVLVMLVAWPAWADTQDAEEAYNRGDYATAVKELRPLAEQGNAWAQNNLGFMYRDGTGVAQDYAEAVRWYRLAAEQGHTSAQFNLGNLYADGYGVPQDYVQAHMWWNLAASQGYEVARTNRDFIAAKMTPAQIEEAQRLAREWLAAHP